jgi:hypothetical protein
MKELPELLDDLSDAINQALLRSGHVLDAAAALENAVGGFRICIDLILPQTTNPNSSALRLASDPTGSDVEFLRLPRVKN